MFLKYLCARLWELFPFDPLTILIKSFPFYRWESEGLHHLLTQQIRARARVQSQTVHTLCHNIMLVDWSTEQALGIPLTIQMWKLDSERLINLVKVLQAISGLWSTSLEFHLVPTGSLDPQAALWQPLSHHPGGTSLSLSLSLSPLRLPDLPLPPQHWPGKTAEDLRVWAIQQRQQVAPFPWKYKSRNPKSFHLTQKINFLSSRLA